MKNNTLKHAKLNALAGYLNFAITALLTFVISPLLVKYIGPFDFGVWKGCQKLLSFATVADGRSSQALKWVIANKESRNNIAEKRRAVGSALKVWLVFFPFLVIILTLLIAILPTAIKGVPENQYGIVRSIGFILGANIVLTPLLGIPDAVLVGANRGYRSIGIQTFWFIISNISMLLCAYFKMGIESLAFVVLLATVLNGVNVFLIAKGTIPWFGANKPNSHDFRVFLVLVFGCSSGLLLQESCSPQRSSC